MLGTQSLDLYSKQELRRYKAKQFITLQANAMHDNATETRKHQVHYEFSLVNGVFFACGTYGYLTLLVLNADTWKVK